MGIRGFLAGVLESAGRTIDLRDYAAQGIRRQGNNKRPRRRPLRIGIDVSSWIYKAAHGFGDMLGDERHLTNYGRATLVSEQQNDNQNRSEEEKVQAYISACTKFVMQRLERLREESKADLLIVLDGLTPPVKATEVQRRRAIRHEQVAARDEPVDPHASPTTANDKRIKGFRRAGAGRHFSAIIDALMDCFRESQVSFMVAPYEADSQLAYLSNHDYLDLIITEDSDLVAHGAKAILYKFQSEPEVRGGNGILLQFVDLGSVTGGLQLIDFSLVMMTVLFVSVGCDYCDKLRGIGLLTASRIVRKAFLELNDSATTTKHAAAATTTVVDDDPLSQVFSQLYRYSYVSNYSEAFQKDYEERFLAALVMYRHPVVYDPLERQCVIASSTLSSNNPTTTSTTSTSSTTNNWDALGDPDLMSHPAYAALVQDSDRIQQIVGQIPNVETTTAAVEGRLQRQTNTNNNSTTNLSNNTHIHNEPVDSSDDEHLESPQKGMATQEETVPGALFLQQQSNHAHPHQDDDTNNTNEEPPSTPPSSSQKKTNGERVVVNGNGGGKPYGPISPPGGGSGDSDENGLVVHPRTRSTSPAITSQEEEESPSHHSKSPNLLCSTTPEQTLASSARSPNLLCSSTPEKTLASSQEQPPPQQPPPPSESSQPASSCDEAYDV